MLRTHSIALVLFSFCFSVAAAPLAEKTKIILPHLQRSTESQYNYYITLLDMALKATIDKYGDYELIISDIPMRQRRQLLSLGEGKINVIWSATSQERETNYQAVYSPLSYGLFGYRVFLVNSQTLPQFKRDIDVDWLKKLVGVQGRDWPDTEILLKSGFNIKTSDYKSCFALLEKGFADYFPRSILEVGEEVSYFADLDIYIEPNYGLYYPNLMYFFVRKDEPLLGKRILDGLTKIEQDGSKWKMFINSPFYQHSKKIKQNRHFFKVDNPFSSEKSRQLAEAIYQQQRY